MKIFFLVAEHGYSFVNQAKALAKGLEQIGVENAIERVTHSGLPLEKLKKFGPDLILSIGSWHSYPFLVKKPQSLGFKVVPWLVSNRYINKYVREYNQLSLILTTSKHCQEIFSRDGIKNNLIKVLPEAVDPEFWHQLEERELADFLKIISISEKDLYLPANFDLVRAHQEDFAILFTTGSTATNKGAQEVIQALGKIKNSLGSLQWLYIIKTWPSADSFSDSLEELRLIQKFGLRENIRYFVGEFSQEFIRGLMSFCTIYVAPSRTEGFGLPLVEAQMCGKPVISIQATSTQEVVKDGVTGLLAKAELVNNRPRANIESLSRHLKTLLKNKRLRLKMGKEAKALAIQKFSPKAIACQLIKLINQN
jgi:glycosyltransferase involved in cell wall biosynthesis